MAFLAMPNILLTEESTARGRKHESEWHKLSQCKRMVLNKERNRNITKSYLDNKEMIPEPPTLPAVNF
jgi:hypothetical protein